MQVLVVYVYVKKARKRINVKGIKRAGGRKRPNQPAQQKGAHNFLAP
jgi:hypothetical protein